MARGGDGGRLFLPHGMARTAVATAGGCFCHTGCAQRGRDGWQLCLPCGMARTARCSAKPKPGCLGRCDR